MPKAPDTASHIPVRKYRNEENNRHEDACGAVKKGKNMKDRIIRILMETGRSGMNALIDYMEESGFFYAPCSGAHHLSKPEGLAEHSLNVYETMISMNLGLGMSLNYHSIAICALLHDIGKMGQYGKPGYIPNMLKGRATKANPDPQPYQSDKKPYVVNPDLLYVDHEVRSVVIVSKYIELTEEEQQAILWHNGLYGPFKYEIQGKETPLYMLLHFADIWASRVIEEKDVGGEDE